MHEHIRLILYIYICTLSLGVNNGLNDQLFPKRLDKFENRTDLIRTDVNTKHDDPLVGIGDLGMVKSSSSTSECSIICFILLNNRDFVNCRSRQLWQADANTPSVQPIYCESHLETGELILGRKESVRSLIPGSLRTLLLPGHGELTRTGQLYLQLNLNMVYLDVGMFRGLGGLITDVRILNTVFMHPDSLIDLQRLRFFEITSGKSPKLWRNESVPDTNFKSTPSQSAHPNGLFYVRLKPFDMTSPITFNLNVECYQCPQLNMSFENLVVFKLQDSLGNLNVIYPHSCPIRANAIGCSMDSITDLFPLEEHLNGNQTDLGLPNMAVNQFNESAVSLTHANPNLSSIGASSSQSTQSLTIALSIWCTILTIIFVGILILIFLCSRRYFDPKYHLSIPFFERFHQRPLSVEETSSDSGSLGFYPPHQQHHHQSTKSIQPSTNDLLINHLMNDSHSSFNAFATVNGRSTSVHSLRDKSIRSRYYPNTMNSLNRSRRSRHMDTKNRSIGSQTDFTDLDSDMNTYSTLGRTSERYKSIRVQDGPRRTASHQFLPYSSKNPDRWDGLVFHQAHYIPRHQRNSFHSGHELNPDLLILMIDGKPTSHPPIRSLPPAHPLPKSIMSSNANGLNSTIYSASSRPAINV